MAALLSYENLILRSIASYGGELTSPNAFASGLPLTNALTRQLSEYAEITTETTLDLRFDFGVMTDYVVSLIGLLGIQTGTACDVTITASDSTATGTDRFNETYNFSSADRDAMDTPHIAIPIDVEQTLSTPIRFWRVQLALASGIPRIAHLWLGPVFGGSIADASSSATPAPGTYAPPITRFRVGPVDPSQTSNSPGAQAYARDLTRVRSLAFRYEELEQYLALGRPWVEDQPTLYDMERIGRMVGSARPCLVCARNDNAHLRHRTLVYGANIGTWEVEHTGGNRYSSTGELIFKGEN